MSRLILYTQYSTAIPYTQYPTMSVEVLRAPTMPLYYLQSNSHCSSMKTVEAYWVGSHSEGSLDAGHHLSCVGTDAVRGYSDQLLQGCKDTLLGPDRLLLQLPHSRLDHARHISPEVHHCTIRRRVQCFNHTCRAVTVVKVTSASVPSDVVADGDHGRCSIPGVKC